MIAARRVRARQSSTKRLAFITNNAADFWTIARKGTEKADAELRRRRRSSSGSATAPRRRRSASSTTCSQGRGRHRHQPGRPGESDRDAERRGASRRSCSRTTATRPDSKRECYVGTDNVAAGRQAGELIKEALPQGGKIAIFVGKLDARNAQERLQGIKEAIAGTNIEIIDVRTDDTDQVRAKANVSEMLVEPSRTSPRSSACGATTARRSSTPSRDASKIGQVKIIAFDEDDETLTGVKSGAIVGTVVQQPYEFGYQSITLLAKALKGDRSGIPASQPAVHPDEGDPPGQRGRVQDRR